jgi:regulatory protein
LHDKERENNENFYKAKQYALKLLSYRGRSEKELGERLAKKGFKKTAISRALTRLKELGFIDDKSLAETLKREALSKKLLSQSGAKKLILARGISRNVVDAVFHDNEIEDIKNAKFLVDKKWRVYQNYPLEIIRRRLYNVLLRRGYSSETIICVLKEKLLKEEG